MSARVPARGHTSKHVSSRKHHATSKHHPSHHKKPATHHTGHKVTTKARHPHHAKAVGFAIGDLLPVCAFEAMAMSLRLAGARVHDDDVAELWHLLGEPAQGVPVGEALAAAALFGLAGYRPLLGGFAMLDVGGEPFERLYGTSVLAIDTDAEPYQEARRGLEPFGGTDPAGFPASVFSAFGYFAARHEVDDFGLKFAAAPSRGTFGVADLDAHAVGHEVDDWLSDGREFGEQEQLRHESIKQPVQGVPTAYVAGHSRDKFPTVPDGSLRFPLDLLHPCFRYETFILSVSRPGPHAVLATADGWWSWGELYDPWPCRVSEAWAVRWI